MCSWSLFLSVGAWVGTLLTRVLWRGLLLRTAWASNSCDKCSSHGDRSRFSQTNNGRMFICGSPHLGRSACLPLSLDKGIGLCVFDCLSLLFLSFLSGLFVFPSAFSCFTSFPRFFGLVCCVFYLRRTPQHHVKMSHVYCTVKSSS